MINRKKLAPFVAVAVAAVIGAVVFAKRNRSFLYAGSIEATKVDLSSRVSSVIARFHVDEGSKIEKGDKLIDLACEDLKLAAELAAGDYDRAERLFRSGSMPKESYEHLRIKRDDSALRVSWCQIPSPFKGTVLNTYREANEYVVPGTKLLTLADLSEVWAIVYVPQQLLSRLSLGKQVTGYISEMNMKEFQGKIRVISDQAEFTPKNVQTREERTRLVYGIKVTFPNPDGILKPGMTIEVKLE